MRAPRFVWAAALVALHGAACDALFGDATQCSNDAECARRGRVCSADGFCELPRSDTQTANAAIPPALDAGESSARTAPSEQPEGLALAITPAIATVVTGMQQAFSATSRDGDGNPSSPQPAIEWSVGGGGSIAPSGIFTAGDAGGGPFTVTARAGALTATASVTVKSIATLTIGETNILNVADSGNANLLLAQEATLAQAATLQSLSFYVTAAAGKLRLGLYDATGPNGGPGAKKAETDEVVAAVGWVAVPVKTPILLSAGTYWLAYTPESSDLQFRKAGDGTGKLVSVSQPYGPMPATFPAAPNTENEHWSFYATLTR